MCPLYKTVGMMRCLVHFYDEAKKIINESPPEAKVTWNIIANGEPKANFHKLSDMKFEDPK
jgi:V-type H+-transporting ATPase subunit A